MVEPRSPGEGRSVHAITLADYVGYWRFRPDGFDKRVDVAPGGELSMASSSDGQGSGWARLPPEGEAYPAGLYRWRYDADWVGMSPSWFETLVTEYVIHSTMLDFLGVPVTRIRTRNGWLVLSLEFRHRGAVVPPATSVWLRGGRPHDAGKRLFTLTSPAEQRQLSFRVVGDSAWTVSGITLEAVKWSDTYRWFRAMLVVAWGSLFVVAAVVLFRQAGVLVSLPLIGMSMVTISLALIDNDTMRFVLREVGGLLDAVSAMVSAGGDAALPDSGSASENKLPAVVLQKQGHFVCFLLLAFLQVVFRKRLGARLWQLVGACWLLALATEAMQRHVVGRSSSIADAMIDLEGAVVGLLLALVVTLLWGWSVQSRSRS